MPRTFQQPDLLEFEKLILQLTDVGNNSDQNSITSLSIGSDEARVKLSQFLLKMYHNQLYFNDEIERLKAT